MLALKKVPTPGVLSRARGWSSVQSRKDEAAGEMVEVKEGSQTGWWRLKSPRRREDLGGLEPRRCLSTAQLLKWELD